MATVLSVNLAVPRPNSAKDVGVTGIDKRPTADSVLVRAPGAKVTGFGSGLVGDDVFDREHHGGDDQAVYAYAREDLDLWGAELGRDLPGGVFGENLTTAGIEVTGALIGERWRIGEQVLLEVSVPRIPCATFALWMAEERWIKRFTIGARPGTYLRVIEAGAIRAGDPITVVSRPEHDVTVGVTFRALTREPDLLPRLVGVDALPASVRERAGARTTPSPGE
jgi:MOSC domain-containing protein YiiM